MEDELNAGWADNPHRLLTCDHKQSKEAKINAYSEWATYYDTEKSDLALHSPKHISELVFKHTSRNTTAKLLDAGCGTGLMGPAIASVAKAAGVSLEMVGFDFSQAMLDRAAEKDCYDSLVCGDLMEPLPFADAHFDMFTAAGVFRDGHVAPIAIVGIAQKCRVGAIGVVTVRLDTLNACRPEYEEMFKRASLEVVEEVLLPYIGTADAYYIVFRKIAPKS